MSDIFEVVLAHDGLADLDPGQRRLALRDLLATEVPASELQRELDALCDRIDGYGPLTGLIADPSVTDVLVNGPGEVWVERNGALEPSGVSIDAGELGSLVERTVAAAGGRVDPLRPVADVRLADGSRMHVVLPPLAPQGPLVSVRCFPKRWRSLAELREAGMVTGDQAERLTAAVGDRRSVLIAGATGTGKTTLLAALLGEVSSSDRIVLIEETPEVPHIAPHMVSLVARPSNVEGRGEITLADLVIASLRMRPDRIVVGEVRGAEAAAALTAMSTGHEGSLLTIHARSCAGALERFAALAFAASGATDPSPVRDAVREAIDVCVHVGRSGGLRKVTEIVELGR